MVGTGTITAVNNLEFILGSGTVFLDEFDTGHVIKVGDETRVVETLISQTELIIDRAFTVSPSASAFTVINNLNIYDKYKNITLYETIEFTASNTGAVTQIPGTTIDTKHFGKENFVLVSEVIGGYPSNVTPLDGGGDPITASIDSDGVVTLSDPYTGDLAIIYGIDIYESKIDTIQQSVQDRFIDAIGFSGGSEVTIVQDLNTPTTDEVPSTQAVVDRFEDNEAEIDILNIDLTKRKYYKMAANLATTSNTVLTNITDLSITVTSGKSYRIYVDLIGQSAATTTGFTIGMVALDSADGNVSFTVQAGNNSAEGAAGEHQGRIRSLSGATGLFQGGQVFEANQNCRIGIMGIFDCTVSGTICPAFRSEVSGSQVTIYAGSIIEAIEL